MMYDEVNYKREIDEVFQLKILFTSLWIKTTDFSQLNVPAKIANIYNMKEIEKNSRKKLIKKQTLAKKVVMMMEEKGSKNFYNIGYQDFTMNDRMAIYDDMLSQVEKLREFLYPVREKELTRVVIGGLGTIHEEDEDASRLESENPRLLSSKDRSRLHSKSKTKSDRS